MREIFFDEKLGETRRNSEGVRTARARMGCEPHGQGWERWERWEQWEGWDNPRLTYSAIADNPKGGLAGKGGASRTGEDGSGGSSENN